MASKKMNTPVQKQPTQKNYIVVIWTLSIVIPLLVAILLFMPTKLNLNEDWVGFLPHLNGALNSATSLALILGLVFIKAKNVKLHQLCMVISFILGAIFLISYVIYHASADSTVFGDLNHDGVLDEAEKAILGNARVLYLIILLTHIVMAIIVVPFVLLAMYYAWMRSFVKHKKIVKYAYPIWLYVSITGVIVYLMISPYYNY